MAPRIELVGVHQIDGLWPRVADGFERARARTGSYITSDYLWSECRSGAAFLLVAVRDDELLAAGVFRFDTWPSGKKLRFLSLFGKDMKTWLPQGLLTVKGIMRVGGADKLVFDGRPGWRRVIGARVLWSTFEVTL